jgi:flagellar basal body-associated protein FliL
MKKRKWIYIISVIIILIVGVLVFSPYSLSKIKFVIKPPKTYQQCISAGGKQTLGDPHIADGETCEINGKVFSPWSF